MEPFKCKFTNLLVVLRLVAEQIFDIILGECQDEIFCVLSCYFHHIIWQDHNFVELKASILSLVRLKPLSWLNDVIVGAYLLGSRFLVFEASESLIQFIHFVFAFEFWKGQ